MGAPSISITMSSQLKLWYVALTFKERSLIINYTDAVSNLSTMSCLLMCSLKPLFDVQL